MGTFASFLGWLAAFGILVVGACKFIATRRAVSAAADQSPAAQALRQDLAYLAKQASNLRQLKQTARASGSEYDEYIEDLEWRQFVDDAVRFIIAARAEGSKEFLNGAASVRTQLRALGLADLEFEQLLSDL